MERGEVLDRSGNNNCSVQINDYSKQTLFIENSWNLSFMCKARVAFTIKLGRKLHSCMSRDDVEMCTWFILQRRHMVVFIHTAFIGMGLPLLFYASISVIKPSNFKYNCSQIVRKSSHSAKFVCYPPLLIMQSTIRHPSFVVNQFSKFVLIKKKWWNHLLLLHSRDTATFEW